MVPKTKHNNLGQRVNYKTQCLSCYICNRLNLYDGIYNPIVVRVGRVASDNWQDFSPKSLTPRR
jgi:hypothetical protein